jgi:hypothetical protein
MSKISVNAKKLGKLSVNDLTMGICVFALLHKILVETHHHFSIYPPTRLLQHIALEEGDHLIVCGVNYCFKNVISSFLYFSIDC